MSETLQSAFLPSVTLTGTETLPVLSGPPNGVERQTTTAAIAGLAAPATGTYLVKDAITGLSAERVVTDTATIATDWGTAGQAKLGVVDSSLARGKLAPGNAGRYGVTSLTGGAYILVDADVVLDGSVMGATADVTLPPAGSHLGRVLWVKGNATEGIDLTPTGGTINGAATVGLAAGTEVAMFVAAGTDWVLVFAIGFP